MLLDVQGLTKSFRRPGLHPLHVIQNISFTVDRGETLAILGRSGCGKSTVGRCILRLEPVDQAAVRLDGTDIAGRGASARTARARMQMVFQDPYGSINPAFTTRRTLADALRPRRLRPTDLADRSVALLESVGLAARHLESRPEEMSGGQLQRLSIARALANDPDFLFLDEPTSALDMSVRGQIVNLLAEAQEQRGLAYLLISHDIGVIRALSHRILVMHEGRIVECGPTNRLLAHPEHSATVALLEGMRA
ncbi:MAG: dipeptide/oligopeptide/nickel ABC transporter ATP-binding protein [Sphingobium sp.]